MKRTCKACGVELGEKQKERLCNPCKYAAYKRKMQRPVALGLNCPWQNGDFLRGWQGRVPDPEWGF